jgi:hypothetical protein
MRTAIRRTLGFGLALAMATGIAATATSDAEADVVPVYVGTTGKGIAGGALLGGEVGFLVLAGAGARAGWMYGTIPTALAIGGGVGGYFVEKGVADGSKVPMFMLAGGMALVIPTVVIALSAGATSYQADEGGAADTGTKPAAGGAGSGGASTGGPKPPQRGIGPLSQHHVAPIMPRSFALLNFDEKISPRVSVPAVQVSPMYSSIELSQFGGTQRYQVDAPLLAITF